MRLASDTMDMTLRVFGGLACAGCLLALLGACLNLTAEAARQSSRNDVFGFGRMGPGVWRAGVVLFAVGAVGLLVGGMIFLAT